MKADNYNHAYLSDPWLNPPDEPPTDDQPCNCQHCHGTDLDDDSEVT